MRYGLRTLLILLAFLPPLLGAIGLFYIWSEAHRDAAQAYTFVIAAIAIPVAFAALAAYGFQVMSEKLD